MGELGRTELSGISDVVGEPNDGTWEDDHLYTVVFLSAAALDFGAPASTILEAPNKGVSSGGGPSLSEGLWDPPTFWA